MKITIIGANSYIGRNMVFMLRHKSDRMGRIKLCLYDCQDRQLDGEEGYHRVNILDTVSVKDMEMDADIIFIFAGKTGTGQGFQDYTSFLDVNEAALLNILTEYVRQGSCARIVFPSTRLVYKGKHGKLKEGDEKEFHTIYAMNKYACEQYLAMYHRMYGAEYVVLRICVPYGTMVSGVSSYGTAEFMLAKAGNGEDIPLYGDGSIRRTITHIEDICSVMLKSAISPRCCNDVFNVGGEDYSLQEMAAKIAGKYSVEVRHIAWPEQSWKMETGDTVFDSGKLDSVLNCPPEHTFEKWIERI